MTLHEEEGAPVVVLGATGTTGSQVADLLEAADVRVRRASRRSPWRFDWDDASTWPSLFDGAGAVYVVLPEDPMDLTPFTRVLADAGVERAVVLTARNPGVSGDGIASGAEEVFGAAAPASTFLRPSWFAQGFTTGLFAAQLDATGELRLPVGDGREPFIDARDISRVAATLLRSQTPGPSHVELSGPQSLSFAEAVEIVGRRTGRALTFADIGVDEWRGSVAPYLKPRMVDALANLFDAIRAGRDDHLSDGVHDVLGEQPHSLEAVVARESAVAR
ncbi:MULTISPECIES: Rossmann-fold NAD(P)-binding domain-containing protein [Microbacterium]|uniref:NAD(P)H azoreductase n=2 Tax=Microbacterium TaxID=33882 RepID=A0A3Q9J7N0_9MICO|nr:MULTISPECIES: hypothetical protein [Microbacterium]AZS42109.1 NAD(P)H azoreductase [Microbacterium oxydans]KKX97523.1 hypothetical protein AAY78_13090 [Microbacterium sp. Ag1]